MNWPVSTFWGRRRTCNPTKRFSTYSLNKCFKGSAGKWHTGRAVKWGRHACAHNYDNNANNDSRCILVVVVMAVDYCGETVHDSIMLHIDFNTPIMNNVLYFVVSGTPSCETPDRAIW